MAFDAPNSKISDTGIVGDFGSPSSCFFTSYTFYILSWRYPSMSAVDVTKPFLIRYPSQVVPNWALFSTDLKSDLFITNPFGSLYD
jgi:hypothetical protein